MNIFKKLLFLPFNLIVVLVLSIIPAVQAQAPESLTISSTGLVGIGTDTPNSKLHVQATNDAQILVENTTSAVAERVMFQLQNNGKTRFVIANAGDLWTFDNAGASFQINKAGTGLNEFRVEADGDLVALGRSFATQHINTSSRESKTDFVSVDEKQILKQLAALPISQWRYKTENKSQTHIGPVAEDFQKVFSLSDGRHISTIDADGVALAAIKGLHQIFREKEAEILILKQANQQLEQRLDQLEKVLLNKAKE